MRRKNDNGPTREKTGRSPHFGERLRELRLARGWTQAGLGEKAGMSHSAISHIEVNRSNVSLDNLLALARALEMPLAQILDGCEA